LAHIRRCLQCLHISAFTHMHLACAAGLTPPLAREPRTYRNHLAHPSLAGHSCRRSNRSYSLKCIRAAWVSDCPSPDPQCFTASSQNATAPGTVAHSALRVGSWPSAATPATASRVSPAGAAPLPAATAGWCSSGSRWRGGRGGVGHLAVCVVRQLSEGGELHLSCNRLDAMKDILCVGKLRNSHEHMVCHKHCQKSEPC
jgi:hypothetical protein